MSNAIHCLNGDNKVIDAVQVEVELNALIFSPADGNQRSRSFGSFWNFWIAVLY